MANRPDKRNRKAMIASWQAEQQAIARAEFPLPVFQLQALFDWLNIEFPKQGCEHNLRLVSVWCHINAVNEAPLVAWLHDNGGFCDCEALCNSEERFQAAMTDN